MRRLLLLMTLAGASACAPSLAPITAPPPVPTRVAPEQPASAITVAASYDMDKLRREMLATLPNPLSSGETRETWKIKLSVSQIVETPFQITETVYDQTIRRVTNGCKKIPLANLICNFVDQVVMVPRQVVHVIMKPVNVTTTVPTPVDAVVRHRVVMRSFDVSLNGDRYTATADLEFSVQTIIDAKLVTAGVVSCGVNEPMAKLRLVQSGTMRVSGDEKLIISRDPWTKDIRSCNLTAFDIPVERVLKWIPSLEQQLNSLVDKQIEKLPGEFALKPTLDAAWSALSQPLALTNDKSAWLVVAPESLYSTQPTGNGTVVSLTTSLIAKPTIVIGDKPKTKTQPRPTLVVKPIEPGFSMMLVGALTYDEASKRLTAAVRDREFKIAIAKLQATKARVYGSDSSLVVAVDIRKPARGTIYLTGVPAYDTLTNTISIANLDFTAQTRSVLVNTAVWAFADRIRSELAKRATFRLDDKVVALRNELKHKEVDLHSLGTLDLGVDRVQPLGVYPTRTDMRVLVQLKGQATIVPAR